MRNIDEELYSRIVTIMPIPCVDLVVRRPDHSILLLKRRNEPARGAWWFPGGRILFGEPRKDAAIRLLREECGLNGVELLEGGTFDVFFDVNCDRRHAVTTVFEMLVEQADVQLDDQSDAGLWRPATGWLEMDLRPFVRQRLVECQLRWSVQ